MAKTSLAHIYQISPGQSVIIIFGGGKIPVSVSLGLKEKEYAEKQLGAGEDYVFINSYEKCVYLVSQKEDGELYKIREELRRTAYKMRKLIRSNNHDELVITSEGAYDGAVLDFAEGLLLSTYSFRKYKTKDDECEKQHYPSRLLLHGNIDDKSIKWLDELTNAIYFTRDLINEPANHLNAIELAEEIRKTGDEAGFTIEVFSKSKIEALKMGGLLAVNKGSVDPPVFCILEWKPANALNKNPIVLVGKGIVFDSGGLNIKTGESMSGMKSDMAGAAIVSGVLYTAAKARIPLHVVGLVPSTDNRPGGNAYAQGDIITMHNKMTVEVGNTDAEGRLILADAVSYASKCRPELIVNIATLTGSAAMTFGSQAIAAMTNADMKYYNLLEECGKETYERIAALPFWEEYGEQLKSDLADIKNIGGGREAGAIIAGKFIEKFAEYPLIHLDIAGTELLKKDDYYKLKNGTASGLRLLSLFLKKMSENYSQL